MRMTLSRFGLNVGVLVASRRLRSSVLRADCLRASLRPPEVEVLAATRRLQVGEVLGPSDLTVLTVYQDQATAVILPAALSDTIGAVVTLPLAAGQPIPAGAVLARSSAGTRLSALLADRA